MLKKLFEVDRVPYGLAVHDKEEEECCNNRMGKKIQYYGVGDEHLH